MIISIHAPHTRSDIRRIEDVVVIVISIHAPHTRSDVIRRRGLCVVRRISIHAPHTRSDRHRAPSRACRSYFNPRSSYEERLCKLSRVLSIPAFQSTLLIRGATFISSASTFISSIFQSTLLIRGATCPLPRSCPGRGAYFNPRSSYEERLSAIVGTAILRDFNPRSSYEERPSSRRSPWRRCNFNPRSSYEERR